MKAFYWRKNSNIFLCLEFPYKGYMEYKVIILLFSDAIVCTFQMQFFELELEWSVVVMIDHLVVNL